MTKKLFVALLAVGMSLSLLACGNEAQDEASVSSQEKASISGGLSDDPDSLSENQADKINEFPSICLLDGIDRTKALFVSDDGADIETVYLRDYSGKTDFEYEDELLTGRIIDCKGEWIYVEFYSGVDEIGKTQLAAINRVTCKVQLLSDEQYGRIVGVSIFNNENYITSCDLNNNYVTTRYYVDGHELIKDDEYTALYDDGFGSVFNIGEGVFDLRKVPDVMMQQYGYLIKKDYVSNSFYVIYSDNTVKDITSIEVFSEVGYWGYSDANYVVYSVRDDVYRDNGYNVLDIEKDECYQILPAGYQVKALVDGVVYYISDGYDQEGYMEYSLYAYDIALGESTVIYSTKAYPLYDMIEPCINGLSFYDGVVYFIDTDGDRVCWKKAEKNGLEYTVSEICEIDYSSPIDEYGTVYSRYAEKTCEECGEVYAYYCTEYIEFDSSIDNYEKINETVENYFNDGFDRLDNISASFDFGEAACEYHGTRQGCEYEEIDISDVQALGSHYISICWNGYWYGGGAHGATTLYFVLFDTDTGEVVSLGDLAGISEEEFRNLVASKVVEDFEENNVPYFITESDALYEHVYDEMSFDYNLINFDQDGIWVNFAPYDLAPYAAGYICFRFTYDELGITDL